MTESTPECPKCGRTMMEGFIADFTHGREQSTTTTWVEGAPILACGEASS